MCPVLNEKFGTFSNSAQEAVAAVSAEEIQAVLLEVGTTSSLTELGLPE